ncbi:MAG: hypothetical protein ACYDIE_02580 [Candidatus Krumholzibacteriia bacterium]
MSCLALVLPLLLPAAAPAFQSDHQRVDLVWNLDGAECAAVPMTLTGDNFWSVTTPAPASDGTAQATVYFQYMVDGNLLPACYGKDITREFGLLFGPNLPSVVAPIAVPGYTTFTLDESALVYSVTPAPGLIHATITYEGQAAPAPDALLAATRATVRDQTAAIDLGAWGGADAQSVLTIAGLLPARTYALVFSAPGYQSASVIEELPDAGPRDIMITLRKLVPTDRNSWGACKTLYR